MSKTNFSKYCKYGAYKFQSFLTKYFKFFVIAIMVLFICIFFMNLVIAFEKTLNGPIYTEFGDTAFRLSLLDYFKIFFNSFPQNNPQKINWWQEDLSVCVGNVILDLFYIIAFIGLIISIILSFKKPKKPITKLLPFISLMVCMIGIAIGMSILSKQYKYDPGYLTPSTEPDWYFSWAFYILIVMIVFYAAYFGLYLYFRNRTAPEKPVKAPKLAKEKPLTDKERIAQLEREVEELKKQSTDNPPPAEF